MIAPYRHDESPDDAGTLTLRRARRRLLRTLLPQRPTPPRHAEPISTPIAWLVVAWIGGVVAVYGMAMLGLL